MSMEPVEIDLTLKQNVVSEGEKATSSIVGISKASDKMRAEFEKNLAAQKKVITLLTAELEKLKQKLGTPVTTNDAELIAEKQKLGEVVAQLEKKLTTAEQAYAALNARGKKSGEGLKSTTAQAKATAKGVGNLNMSIQQVARELPSLAISPQMFILAISNNLPILQDELRRTKIQNDALKASGQATVPVWKQVAKSLFSWQTALVTAVSLGIVFAKDITKWVGELLNFRDATKLSREELKKLTDELAKNMGNELGKMDYLFDRLKKAKKGTDDYANAKRDIVKDYGKYLMGLDSEIVSLNNVAGAHKAITQAIQERARASALSAVYSEQGAKLQKVQQIQYVEIRKNLVEKWGEDIGSFQFKKLRQQLESGERLSYEMQRIVADFNTKAFKAVGTSSAGSVSGVMVDFNAVQQSLDKITKAQDVFTKKTKEAEAYMGNLFDGNNKKRGRTIEVIDAEIAALKKEQTAVSKTAAEYEEYRLAIAKLTKEKEKITGNKKASNKKEKTSSELETMEVDFQEQIDASVIAAMKEGTAKKLAEVKFDYIERRNAIKASLSKIEKLEQDTGITSVDNRKLLDEYYTQITAQYEAEKAAIENAARKEVDVIFLDINNRFDSQLQGQLNQIDGYYNEQLEALRKNIIDRENLQNATEDIEQARLKEKKQATISHELDRLEFEENIALKRQELSNDNLLFETDKQKELLELQLKYAMLRMQKLNDFTVEGGDASEEIQQLKVLIEKLGKELKDLPTRKVEELAEYASNGFALLSSIVGVFDEDYAALLDTASQAAEGIGNIATGDPKSIVEGAMQIASVVGRVINANKQANKEIREFNYDLAQQAIDYSLAVIKAIKDIKAENDSIFNIDYSNTLSQGMTSYTQALSQQHELMDQLGDATVKTGVKKKKFLGITVGTKDVYSDLLKTYPDLIKADGELNRELAETLKQSGILSDETADLLDNIMNAADAATDAIQQVESTLSELVGTLGDDLKSALDSAFESGTDSAEAMMESIGNMMQDLATKALFSAVFGNLLSDLEKQMKASYGADGDMNITDDLAWFFKQYPALVEDYNKGLENIQDEFKSQYGIDVLNTDSTRSGSSTELAQASQTSIDELSGRIMAMQVFTADIRNANIESLQANREMLTYQKAVSGQLETIAKNTAFCGYLEGIDQKLEDINLKGVKLK